METLEKVELIREKCDVSYEEARQALDDANGDVLDAIIELERQGKARPQSAAYSTAEDQTHTVSDEMAQAQADYHKSSRRSRFGERAEQLGDYLRHVLRRSVEVSFVADRNGDRVLDMPVLVLVIALVALPVTLPLLIVGLFFGFRYHFDGMNTVTVDVNDVMDKAAGAADSIKKDVMSNE